jgi:hypothetical protein
MRPIGLPVGLWGANVRLEGVDGVLLRKSISEHAQHSTWLPSAQHPGELRALLRWTKRSHGSWVVRQAGPEHVEELRS